MYSVSIVANSILQEVFKNNLKDFTPMRLQRILYIVDSEYYGRTGDLLMSEKPKAWPYGPVYQTAYFQFIAYSGKAIKSYAKDAINKSYCNTSDEILTDCIKNSLSIIESYSTVELSRMLQSSNRAWLQGWNSKSNTVELNADILTNLLHAKKVTSKKERKS